MLAARLLLRNGGIKPSFLSGKQTFQVTTRLFKSKGNNFSEAKPIVIPQPIKEKAPKTGKLCSFFKVVAAGVSLCAIGGLCDYEMDLSNETGRTFDSNVFWPKIVRDRITTTYKYFGGSVLITTVSVVAASMSKTFKTFVMMSPYHVIFGLLALTVIPMLVCLSLPYREGFGKKQAAFTVFSVLGGIFWAPLFAIYGGPLLIRAGCFAAGILGGLSTLAVCALSDEFLNKRAPLCMGCGMAFAASLGSLFLPATTALTRLNWVFLLGGSILYGGFVLYITRSVIRDAKRTDYGRWGLRDYDPIDMAIFNYWDSVSILKLASILMDSEE